MTERLQFHFSLSCIGEGNGNPLQCSCLENPRDKGAWWAAVYGVAQSQTRLKRRSSSSHLHDIEGILQTMCAWAFHLSGGLWLVAWKHSRKIAKTSPWVRNPRACFWPCHPPAIWFGMSLSNFFLLFEVRLYNRDCNTRFALCPDQLGRSYEIMQGTWPTKKHETKVKPQIRVYTPNLLKSGEGQARRHIIPKRSCVRGRQVCWIHSRS